LSESDYRKLSRSQQIDLILLDMQMPIMNGYEAVKALRAEERTAGIKIIAVTSFALTEEKERIFETGVVGFVAKPIDTRELPAIVQRMIG